MMINKSKIRLVLLLAFLMSSSLALSQGLRFETLNFKEILEMSEQTGKLVFIDFYTDWCAPCRKMSKDVFPLKTVGDYYNNNFLNLKVNAEKGEGVETARRFGISEYPSFIFINYKGEVIYRFSGARDSTGIITEGKKAFKLLGNISKLSKFQDLFNTKKQDKAFLREYVQLLTESGSGGGEPLNEYILLMELKEFTDSANIKSLEKITEYSPAVMDKIIVVLTKLYREDPKAVTFVRLNRAVVKSLSNLIRNSGKRDTIDELEELLEIKKRFSEFGNKDNIISASVGGGIALLPEEELRLLYYKGHNMHKEYSSLFEKYINNYISQNDPVKIEKESLSFQAAIDSSMNKRAAEGKSIKEAEDIRKMGKTINEINGIQYRYYSTFILNGYKYYLENESGSDESEKVSDWIVYAYSICKQFDIADFAVKELIVLNYPQKAKQIIEDLVKLNDKTSRYKPEQIDSLVKLLYSGRK